MNDADLIRLAKQVGNRMEGPEEREKCPKHPKYWVVTRWVWAVGEGPEDSEGEIVRDCKACDAEDRHHERED